MASLSGKERGAKEHAWGKECAWGKGACHLSARPLVLRLELAHFSLPLRDLGHGLRREGEEVVSSETGNERVRE